MTVESAVPPSTLWDQLANHLDAFTAEWQRRGEPPGLAEFVPAGPPQLRQLVVAELVKVDLERRWPHATWRKPIEAYFAEWPELRNIAAVTRDLIYEEYHIRRQNGDTIAPNDYQRRFPEQAARLNELLAVENPHLTTSVAKLGRPEQFQPGQTLDDFDLITRLGSGAFATVFLARQRSLGRLVAVKISCDRGLETQTLVRLDHPNIVRVFDQRRLVDRQLLLMYMQYLPGGTLKDVVDRARTASAGERSGSVLLASVDERLRNLGETPPSDSRTRQTLATLDWPRTVAWLGGKLAAALAHAHAQGVLHRDLKPANVLLAADCNPSLVDFNVSSCSLVPGAAADAFFGGTLAYMSPEQLEVCLPDSTVRAESLDGRTDLYSLGMVLWELLTGERPFQCEGLVDLTSQTLAKMLRSRQAGLQPDDLQRLPDACPSRIVEVLRCCLEADRERRIATARSLRRNLELCLHDELQTRLRPSSPAWLLRARRHPLPPLLIAGLVPNVTASVINISYNVMEIVDKHPDPRVQEVFNWQLVTVNAVAYGIGIAWMLVFFWPVLKSAQHQATRGGIDGEPDDEQSLSRCRLRSLLVGDVLAWVSGVEWLISGLVFPVSLHLALRTWTALSPHDYLHWFASQAICGLLAATMSFFMATRYATLALLPPLVDHGAEDPLTVRAIDQLRARTPWYSYATVTTIFLAIIVMPALRMESQVVFAGLGIVGMACSAVAFRLASAIQHDLQILRVAAVPDDEIALRR